MSSDSASSQQLDQDDLARKMREFIPDTHKDDKYWERRRRNNEAARRSREKRRINDVVMERKIDELRQENLCIRLELRELKIRFNLPLTEEEEFSPRPQRRGSSSSSHGVPSGHIPSYRPTQKRKLRKEILVHNPNAELPQTSFLVFNNPGVTLLPPLIATTNVDASAESGLVPTQLLDHSKPEVAGTSQKVPVSSSIVVTKLLPRAAAKSEKTLEEEQEKGTEVEKMRRPRGGADSALDLSVKIKPEPEIGGEVFFSDDFPGPNYETNLDLSEVKNEGEAEDDDAFHDSYETVFEPEPDEETDVTRGTDWEADDVPEADEESPHNVRSVMRREVSSILVSENSDLRLKLDHLNAEVQELKSVLLRGSPSVRPASFYSSVFNAPLLPTLTSCSGEPTKSTTTSSVIKHQASIVVKQSCSSIPTPALSGLNTNLAGATTARSSVPAKKRRVKLKVASATSTTIGD